MGLVERFRAGLKAAGWEPGDRVVLAVSGGADSMAMLRLASEGGLEGVVGHVHYGLRGEASDGDAQWVAREAARAGWPCRVAHRRVGPNSVQAVARSARYGWLEEVRGTAGCRWVATAHHADDQAETVVLHWLRAADPVAAVAGMPARNGRVIRPLLGVRRAELRDWAEAQGVRWREDASNASAKYLRNRVRHEVMPLLEDVRSGAAAHLARLAGRGREVAEGMAAVRAEATADPLRLAWEPETPFFRERLAAWGRLHGVSGTALRELHAIGAHVEGTGGRVVRERGALVFAQNAAPAEAATRIEPESGGTADGLAWVCSGVPPAGIQCPPEQCWLDADAVVWPLCMRAWRPGDVLAPFGFEGHQRVSDVLTQAKVPAVARSQQRVLVDAEGTVHWVVGVRAGRRAAIHSGTLKALHFTFVGP